MAKSRPHIILSAAITLDGKIATKTGHSKLSSKKDKIRVHKLRAKVDGILVGKNTVLNDDPLLTVPPPSKSIFLIFNFQRIFNKFLMFTEFVPETITCTGYFFNF